MSNSNDDKEPKNSEKPLDVPHKRRFIFTDTDAEDLFLSIMNTARDPLVILDEELRVRIGNISFYKNFHVNPAETDGRLIFDIGNGQWNISKLRSLLEEILPTKKTFDDFEVDHEFQEIGRKVMLLNARQVVGPAPVSEKLILLAIEDVTEKTAAIERARRLANIVQFSDDAIISKTKNGVITTWNEGAEAIFGYTKSEAIGKSIEMLDAPETKGETMRIINRIIGGEVVHNFETKRIRKDGRIIEVSVSISPIKDTAGNVIGASKIARDITVVKQLERQRDQALKAREELIAVVSHELKNPLTTITSSVDLAKRVLPLEKGPEKAQKLLDNIYVAAHRMARITSDLLDVSKFESGHFPLELATVEAITLIEEVITLSLPLALDKAIRIEKHIAEEIGDIVCDRDRMVQALLNLLNNAIKFTGEGGVIGVDVYRVNDQIRFQIKDTGCGIPAEQLPHVFERFWQAKHKQYLGSGLGLYITKSIVETHGGKVGVESRDGEGSTFYFTLPVSNKAITTAPATKAA